MTTELDRLLRKAHNKNCTSGESCYLGTCPVNNCIFLLEEHKHRRWMIYGLVVYLKWLTNGD